MAHIKWEECAMGALTIPVVERSVDASATSCHPWPKSDLQCNIAQVEQKGIKKKGADEQKPRLR